MTVIAMTQDIGWRDTDVAAHIARFLGLNLTHQQQLEQRVAEQMQIDEAVVHRIIAGKASLLDRWAGTGHRLWRCIVKEFLTLAAQDDELILARGAITVLRPINHVICVHVCAPMRGGGPSARKGTSVSQENSLCISKMRRSVCERMLLPRPQFGGGREGPENSDLALNIERIPIAECVEHIARVARCPRFQPTAASRAILADLLCEANKSSLRTHGSTSVSIAPVLSVRVGCNQLKLTGETSSEQAIAIVEEHLRGKDTHTARPCKPSPCNFLYP